MEVVTMLVVGGGSLIAADVAKWCFNDAAQSERYRRNAVSHQERGKRNQIARDTRRQLAQEAYVQRGTWLDMLSECMDEVWEMRNDTRGIKNKFYDIVKQNEKTSRETTLTFDQQEAIRECNFHLNRGIERLKAYADVYLQGFVVEISAAKSAARKNDFYSPEMPDATLPDDFPIVGDNLLLDESETAKLRATGLVDLGCGQVGEFEHFRKWVDQNSQVSAFVTDYDRDSKTWMLSLAKGHLASDMDFNTSVEAQTTSSRRGGVGVIWHSPFGDSVKCFLPRSFSRKLPSNAPWGTSIDVYVRTMDHNAKNIVVAQEKKPPTLDFGLTLSVFSDHPEFKALLKKSKEVSTTTFWIYTKQDQCVKLRLATGEEFSTSFERNDDQLHVSPQIGLRLGHVDELMCKSEVVLVCDDNPLPSHTTASRFFQSLKRRFDEQEEIQKGIEDGELELNRYQLLLDAKLTASNATPNCSSKYETFLFNEDDEYGHVEIQLKGIPSEKFVEGGFVEIQLNSQGIRGRLKNVSGSKLKCSFAPKELAVLKNSRLPQERNVNYYESDFQTRNQLQSLEDFRSLHFLQSKSDEDKHSFRQLRRALLGLAVSEAPKAPLSLEGEGFARLNLEQKRAALLVNSSSLLTLILGPPGTGKTDVIAISVEAFVKANPKATVAIVSQANVAVDEALKKLKERYPDCRIFRDVSQAASDSIMQSSKDLTKIAIANKLNDELECDIGLPDWAKQIRNEFRVNLKEDEPGFANRIVKSISSDSNVLGTTLSMLGNHIRNENLFDLVVVDEAAKASLPECVTAALAAKRLVLVGDHNQLLPYLDEEVLETAGRDEGARREIEKLWNDSLFNRLWRSDSVKNKICLATQYRSRSGIRNAISELFYDSKLDAGRTDDSPIPFEPSLVWVDTCRSNDSIRRVRGSLVSEPEADVVASVLKMLAKSIPRSSELSVGVIAFYKEQRRLLENRASLEGWESVFDTLEFKTVDASQGGQWDIVVLPLTRSRGNSAFIGNSNRLNVALSRAKELAVLVGNFQYAIHDKSADSKLSDLATHVQDNKGSGTWICAPGAKGGIATSFGIRPTRRQHAKRK